MSSWVTFIGANLLAFVLAFVLEVTRQLRILKRNCRFEAVRLAAVETSHHGWAPVRLTWHGWLRTEARMDIRHPDGREWTLRSPA